MIITSSLLHTNMASTPLALILLTLTPSLILLTSQTQAQTPTAPAPAPANLTGILDNGGQYTTFIRLLIETQQITQIESQLNSTNSEGFTVFAPTDNAFQNLKSGAINDLTDQQKTQLILYHVAPTYYTLTQLLIVSNPVRTEASGSNGNWGLNFTSQGNQVNVSTGVVETPINNALRQQFPLAVYQVDKVLLPLELFGAMSPASASAPSPSPKSSNTKSSGNNNTTKASSGGGGDNQKSDALGRNVGLGLVLGLFICMGPLS